MIKEIQIFQHMATGTFYAECRSNIYGKCTQWGDSVEDARNRLKLFVTVHWKEEWPDIEQQYHVPKNSGEGGVK